MHFLARWGPPQILQGGTTCTFSEHHLSKRRPPLVSQHRWHIRWHPSLRLDWGRRYPIKPITHKLLRRPRCYTVPLPLCPCSRLLESQSMLIPQVSISGSAGGKSPAPSSSDSSVAGASPAGHTIAIKRTTLPPHPLWRHTCLVATRPHNGHTGPRDRKRTMTFVG